MAYFLQTLFIVSTVYTLKAHPYLENGQGMFPSENMGENGILVRSDQMNDHGCKDCQRIHHRIRRENSLDWYIARWSDKKKRTAQAEKMRAYWLRQIQEGKTKKFKEHSEKMKAFWKRKKEGLTTLAVVKEPKKRGPKWTEERRQELTDRMHEHWKGITEEERNQINEERRRMMLRYWKRLRKSGNTDRNAEFERKRIRMKEYWAKKKAEGNAEMYKAFKAHGEHMREMWRKQRESISCRKKTLSEIMQAYWKRVEEGTTPHHVHQGLSAVMKRYWRKVGIRKERER
uniref:Uncharacterized protein n=1 Tax=Cacopsylla melanoneura TaxID=428564 RepID=A0A8D8R490_9HEMI